MAKVEATHGVKKPPIFPLLLVSFIGSLGFSIVLPSLVYLVRTFRGGDFLYGALGATYSAFQLFGAPILGELSDKYGRKKILFLSELGSTISWALFIVALYLPIKLLGGFSTSLTGVVAFTLPMLCLFIARAVEGLTGGDVSVANAYIADIATPAERKADFGKMGVAANLGFMVGPVIAGLLGSTSGGLVVPISGALATSLLALILIAFMRPESHPKQIAEPPDTANLGKRFGHEQKECYVTKKTKRANLASILKLDRIPLLLAIYFIFYLGFSLFVASFPLHATETLHWSVVQLGIFFSFLSVVLVITEGPLLSWLSKRFSTIWLTCWGTLVIVFGYLAFTVPEDWAAYLGAGLYAIGNGLMWPSFLTLLSESAGEKTQGYVQGIGNSAGSLASIVGLLIGGVLYAQLKGQAFYVPVVLMLVVFAMSFRLGQTRTVESAQS
jgi:DHA1 family tetracycline resistance protein-like MFS transporter